MHPAAHLLVFAPFAAGLLAQAAPAPPAAAPAPSATAPAGVSPDRLTELLAGADPADLAELRAMQTHVRDLVQRTLPATVSLPGASGVLVERDGATFVLCAAHVTEEADRSIAIRTTDGKRLRGTSLGADHRSDVSLVRVETSGDHPVVAIGRSAKLTRGEWVIMLGHPSGRKPGRTAPVRLGRVLRVPESGYVVTDCTMQAGDSGGPLFDMQGRVVGINSRINRNLAVNMHAPIDALTDQWQELLDGKVTRQTSRRNRSRRGLGATLSFADGAPQFEDVKVDSEAHKAGLRSGDRLFEVDGYDIDDRRSLARTLRRYSVGDEVPVVVYRDGRGIELTLKIRQGEGR
ncbi:MAG: S1C family serine protease [Planctomycetota bacterium]